MNHFDTTGKIAFDVELKTGRSGVQYLRNALDEPDDKFPDKKLRHQFVAFGEAAVDMAEKLRRGSNVTLYGKIRDNEYDAKDGTHVKGYQVIVDSFKRNGVEDAPPDDDNFDMGDPGVPF